MVTRIENKNSNLYDTEVLAAVTINGKGKGQSHCDQKFDPKRKNVREIEFYHVDKELTTPKSLSNGGSICIDRPTSHYSLTDKATHRPSSSFDKGRIPEVTIEKVSIERKEVKQYKASLYSNYDFPNLNKNKRSLATIKYFSDAKNIENHNFDAQNAHQQLVTKNSGPIDSSDANILSLNESSLLQKDCCIDEQALKNTETDTVINTENNTIGNDETPAEGRNLKTTLNKTHKNKVENVADNPITAWKKADIEAIQSYGHKPLLLKSVNAKEDYLKVSLKDGNSLLNDKVKERNQPAIRKYMADKQLEKKEAIKRKKEEMNLQESRKIEKLKELDQKCREITRDSRLNQQSYRKEISDRQPMIQKDFKTLAPKICAPHTSQTTEIPTFTVHVEPSKAIADTQRYQVYDPFVFPSDHAMKTLNSNPLNHLENDIGYLTNSKSGHENIVDRNTNKAQRMAMREKHYKIKKYIEKPEYLSDADNVKDLLKKVVQKCDEKFLSSSSSIESTVSARRHLKHSCDELSSDSSGQNLASANKKERISKLSLTAQKLSEQLKNEEVLNPGLQNLRQMNKVHYHSKFDSQHLNNGDENLSIEEIVKRMTALCPKSKFSEYIPSVTKENKINAKVQDASPEQSFVKPTWPCCTMELPQLMAPPMSVLTIKSGSRAKLKEYVATDLKANVEKNSYYNRLYSPKELDAAITIQAFFRGHKVRKVTSNILKPRTKRMLIRSKDSLFPKLIKYSTLQSRDNKTLVPSSAKDILNDREYLESNFNTKKNLNLSEFRPNYNIDAYMLCRKGRSKDNNHFLHLDNHRPTTCLNKDDLEANTRSFLNHSQSNKCNLKKDLPDFVKPFVDLTETGDIAAFVNSYSSINNKILNRATGDGVNQFLVKDPLLDNDFGQNSQLTKETQTNEIDLKRFRSTPINDSQNFSLSEGPLLDASNSSVEQEVCYSQLKKSRSKSQVTPKLLKMPNSKADLAMGIKGIDEAMFHSSKALSNQYGLTSSDDSSSTLPYVEATLNHSEEAIRSESTANNNEIKQFMTSEEDLENISTYKVPVSKFGVRIHAELMYQDTIGSALDHLRELENLRIISQADAEASKLNSNLQEIELKNVELNNELAQERIQNKSFEKEVQRKKKRLEKGVSINIERIEQEARDRILRLEKECMSKAEAAFQLVGRTLPQNNSEMIATATAAALSASIGILGHSNCNFDNYSIKDSYKYPSCSRPIDKESYSENFSGSSESSQSAVEVSKSDADASESKRPIVEGINSKNPSTSVSSVDETSSNAKVCINETEISVTPDIVEEDFCDVDILNSFEKNDLASSSAIHSLIPMICNPSSSNEEMEIYEEIGTPIFDSHDTSNEIRTESLKDSHINSDKSIVGSKIRKKIPADNTSASYSESFEPDSRTSDASETSSSIQRVIKQTSLNNGVDQFCCNIPVAIKNYSKSSDRTISSPHSQSGSQKMATGALYSTLTLLESLQKEEEIRFNYQKALLKMQEQKLISEARQKLDSVHLEGGSNVRKKQRAILLQLREQKSHIKRFIETQTLAAQQRQLIFLQHKDLLSSTTNISNATTLHSSRVASPSVSHIMDLNLSSSESHNHVNILSFKPLVKSSSELSEDESKSSKKIEEKRIKSVREDSRKSSSPILKDRDAKLIKRDEKSWRRKELYPKVNSAVKSELHFKNEQGSCSYSETDNVASDNENKPSDTNKSEVLNDNGIMLTEVKSVNEASFAPIDTETVAEISIMNENSNTCNISTAVSNAPFHETLALRQIPLNNDISKNISNKCPPKSESFLIDKASSDSEMIVSNKYSSRYSNCFGKESRGNGIPFNLKIPLSPRAQLKQHRRQSSESDDSFTLSQNETASDFSDGGEGKLAALREELAMRRVEAEKLHKEKRKLRRERLASQEQSLKKQIQAYESYIKEAKLEIEKESRELQYVSVKPLIKRPHVAGTFNRKLERLEYNQHEKPFVSDEYGNILLGDKSLLPNKSYTAADFETSHVSSGSSSKKSNATEDSFSSTSMVDSHIDQTFSDNTISFENEVELKSHNENQEIVNDSSDVKCMKEFIIVSTEDLASKEEINIGVLADSYNNIKIAPNSEKYLESSKTEVQKSPDESSVSQESDLSASHASSTETILQSPKKSNSIEMEHGEDLYGINKMGSLVIESVKLPVIPVSKVPENKVDIFIPSFDDDIVLCKETDDETIMEDIIEELPVDIASLTGNEQSALLQEESVIDRKGKNFDLNEKVIICEPLLTAENVGDLRIKANEIAQFIFKNILESSIELMMGLFLRKEKEVSEISGQIQELGEVELKSENTQLHVNSQSSKGVDSSKTCHYSMQVPAYTCTRMALRKEGDLDSSGLLEEILNYESPVANVRATITPESKSPEKESKLVGEANNSKEQRSPVQNAIDSKATGVNADELTSRLLSVQAAHNALDNTLDEAYNIREEFSISSSNGNWPDNEWWISGNSFDAQLELKEEEDKLNAEDEFTSCLLSVQATHNALDSTLNEANIIREEFSVSSSNGTRANNEGWISGNSFDAQLELKEEEDKLNAEIALLEELQLFKKMHPNLVIREVPNKPPPPYVPPKCEGDKEHPVINPITPPVMPAVAKIKSNEIRPFGSVILPQPQSPSNTISVPHRLSKADLRKLAAELFNVVPSKEEDILPVIQSFVDVLFSEWQNGTDPTDVENPSKKEVENISQHNEESDKEDVDSLEVSSQSFQNLLFDLTKELVSEIYILHKAPPTPIWMNVCLPHPAKPWQVVKCLTNENLFSYVMSKVKILMGWEAPTKQESTMVKWARKRRDVVDQILVHELQAEELSWTNYDEEEVEVKNELAQEIMDSLLEDTTDLFQKIVENKIKMFSVT